MAYRTTSLPATPTRAPRRSGDVVTRVLPALVFVVALLLAAAHQTEAVVQCADYHGNTGNVPLSFFGVDDTFLPQVKTEVAKLNATLDTMPCAPHLVVQDAVDAGEMTCPALSSWLGSIRIGNTVNDGIYVCTLPHGFDGIDGCPLCAGTTVNISSDATTGAALNTWTDVTIHRSLLQFEWDATTQAYTQAQWDAIFAHELMHAMGGAGDASPRLASYPSAVWGFSVFYDKWDIWWLERRFGNGPLVGWAPGTYADPTAVPTKTK